MKLQDQVCTQDQANRLKELGVSFRVLSTTGKPAGLEKEAAG